MPTDVHCRRKRRRTPALSALVVFALTLLLVTTRPAVAQAPEDEEKQAVVTVKGMQCPFCAYGIKKHLGKLPGATRVDVELAKNEATVTFEADAEVTDEQIKEAVRKAGFTPEDIKWPSGDEPKETSRAGAIDARVDSR
jgi:copper chaperone